MPLGTIALLFVHVAFPRSLLVELVLLSLLVSKDCILHNFLVKIIQTGAIPLQGGSKALFHFDPLHWIIAVYGLLIRVFLGDPELVHRGCLYTCLCCLFPLILGQEPQLF